MAGIVIQILKLLKLYLKEPCSENLFLKHASTFVFTTCIHVENISQNTWSKSERLCLQTEIWAKSCFEFCKPLLTDWAYFSDKRRIFTDLVPEFKSFHPKRNFDNTEEKMRWNKSTSDGFRSFQLSQSLLNYLKSDDIASCF